MKRFLSILFAISLAIGAFAEYKPSETAEFSVLVCSPGEVIYSQFGHAAIRLCDTAQRVDVVFDYGVFEIGDLVEFVSNFMTGNMYYLLATRSFRQILAECEYEGRGIVEYKLNLTFEEKTKICKLLLWNLKLYNQTYLYNFFEDNCATRIYDVLEKGIPDLQYRYVYKPTTWRDVIFKYANDKSWIGYGIQLGLGLPADTTMSPKQMTFLPDYLGNCIESSTIGERNLISSSSQIMAATKVFTLPWWNNSLLVLWILFLLFVAQTVREFVTKKHCVWCDVVLFALAGIIGCVIWFISFVSIHSLVFPNFNTIWLTPIHLVFAIVWLIPVFRHWSRWYFMFTAVCILIYVVISAIAGQFIPAASLPLMLIFIMRAFAALYSSRLKLS